MKYLPKVSIIIPVYNGSNFLKEAIDSALAQTYNNLEIIVVNDGSNDDGATEEIAKSYGNRIRYFKKENGGVATALNLGIEKMTGEYFSWLSHDDLYYQDKIEKQIDFLNKLGNKKVVLYSNYELIDENNGLISQVIFDHKTLKSKASVYALLRGNINGITLLIPKSAFKQYGVFDINLRTTQDYDMWYRIIQTYEFIHIDDILAKTRIHSNQGTISNPITIEECNVLWVGMIKDLSDDKKIELEGSLYNFYIETIKFLKNTSYDGAVKYCEKELKKILDEAFILSKKCKVSVVIPFYNRIDLVKEAIESVLSQSHENIEIILVDDCSKENYDDLLIKYSKNKSIKFLRLNKNKGASGARNYGIENCIGDYIAFLDSDDLYKPDKISRQLSCMIAANSSISHTSYIRHSDDSDEKIDTSVLNGNVIPRLISRCIIATPTVMVKREIIGNKRFEERFRIGEDVCFWLELVREHDLLGINEYLTIVNVSGDTTAFDSAKMLVGLRNILSYVISDVDYKEYLEEVYRLCLDFCIVQENILGINRNRPATIDYVNDIIVNRGDCPNCIKLQESYSWKMTRPARRLKEYLFILRHSPIISSKKVIKKLCLLILKYVE